MPLPSDCPLLEEMSGEIGLARLNARSLGESEIERARAELMGLAAARRGQDLRLDLGRLEYLASTGLGLFLALNREVRSAGGRLSLHNVRGPVYEVFDITRLTSVLEVRREGQGLPAAASA